MILVIAGATGTGKSELAIELAKKVDGEIINADAFQVYQELSIATAKPTLSMRKVVPHHLFDFVPLNEDYDVERYQKELRNALNEVLSRGKTPIIAGGSGLYLRASLFDYSFSEKPREIDESKYEAFSNEELHAKLEAIDPEEAMKIHPNNRRRVLRAIEIYEQEGKKKSELISMQEHRPIFDCRFFGLKPDRESLYEKVEKRVDRMFEEGLVEETLPLIEKYGRSPHAFQAIGVKELFPYLDGEISLQEAKDSIKKNTRHYIKRQDTFFAHQFEIDWVDGIKEILEAL
jgi:tRNA dimethylallyltransferase